MTRIRFVGLVRSTSQSSRDSRTPHEIAPKKLVGSRRLRKCALQRGGLFAGLRPARGVVFPRPRRRAMTPFFVQIKCQLGKSYQVASKLAESEIASEIYS